MTTNGHEREVLRELAGQVAEIATLRSQEEKKRLWQAHNDLTSTVPVVAVHPGRAWLECIPPERMVCQDPFLYAWEQRLRMQLYHYREIGDDHVVEGEFNIAWEMQSTAWGLDAAWQRQDMLARRKEAMYHLHPNLGVPRYLLPTQIPPREAPIQEAGDIEKLRPISYTVDRAGSKRRLALAQEMFGEILPVRQQGIANVDVPLAEHLVHLRGMHQLLLDVYERPEWVHRLSQYVATALDKRLQAWEREGLLSCNHGAELVGGDGPGWTEALPARGYDEERVRLRDVWGSTDSAPLAGFSPEMLDEFFFRYVTPVMGRFGLGSYGTLEQLHDRIESVRRLPKLRRLSVSPWSNLTPVAEALGKEVALSIRVKPEWFADKDFDVEGLRGVLIAKLRIAREHGCHVALVLSGLTTVQQQPWRLRTFVDVARQAIANVYG